MIRLILLLDDRASNLIIYHAASRSSTTVLMGSCYRSNFFNIGIKGCKGMFSLSTLKYPYVGDIVVHCGQVLQCQQLNAGMTVMQRF